MPDAWTLRGNLSGQVAGKKLGGQGGHNVVSALTDCLDDELAMVIRTETGNVSQECFPVNCAFTQGNNNNVDPNFSHGVHGSLHDELKVDLDCVSYQPPRFFTTSERLNDSHYIGGLPSQMKLQAWEYELKYVSNQGQREYLHSGIKHGFKIVDDGIIPFYECNNYISCLAPAANEYILGLFLAKAALCTPYRGASQERRHIQAHYELP